MKRRIWTVAAALASVAALVAVPSAFAAYTTAKLEVRQTGTSAVIKATLDPNDDPTASVRIFVPTGTQLTTTQAPGTSLGPVRAIVKALDLAGADLPLEGNLVVAAAGQIAPATQAACLGSVTPIASWVMVLSAAGQTLARSGLSRGDDRDAGRARPCVHPGLPAAAGHPRRNSGPGDVRRQAVQRRAHDQRRLQPVARRLGRVLDAVPSGSRAGQRRRHRRVAGSDRRRCRHRRRAESRESRRRRDRHRTGDAGRPGSCRGGRHDLRRPAGEPAEAARPRSVLGQRRVHVPRARPGSSSGRTSPRPPQPLPRSAPRSARRSHRCRA